MSVGAAFGNVNEIAPLLRERTVSARHKTTAAVLWTIGLLLGTEAGLRGRAWYRHGSHSPVADLYEENASTGRRLKPGAAMRGSDRALTINQLGFRGPEIVVPKPPRAIRIAALGDSTTFGLEASDDASVWVERMATELNARSGESRFDAINGGVPGYTLADSIKLLEDRIAVLGPDVIVVDQVATDIAAHARRQFGEKAKSSAPKASLAKFFQEHSILVNLLRQNASSFTARLLPERRQNALDVRGVEEFSGRLSGLLEHCRRSGWHVVLCTAPRSFGDPTAEVNQFALAASALAHNPALSLAGLNDAFDRYNDAIRRIARDTGTPLADLDASVPKRAAYFVDAVHLNDAGHALVGRLVANAVRDSLIQSDLARSDR